MIEQKLFAKTIKTIQFQMLQNLQEPQDLLEMKAITFTNYF